MALIHCTECGKEFSDKASVCPNCNCPIEEILKELASTGDNAASESEAHKYKLKVFLDKNGIDLAALIREDLHEERIMSIPAVVSYLNSNNSPNSYSEIKKAFKGEKIRCKNCYKLIFAEDEYCIFCGQVQANDEIFNPITKKFEVPVQTSVVDSSLIRCPNCMSTQIAAKNKGFKLGIAALGGILLGPIGLLGGAIGSNETLAVCLACGYTWEPGN